MTRGGLPVVVNYVSKPAICYILYYRQVRCCPSLLTIVNIDFQSH